MANNESTRTRKPSLRSNQFAMPGGIPEAGPSDFTQAEAAAKRAGAGKSNFVSPGYADHFAPEGPKPDSLLKRAASSGAVKWAGRAAPVIGVGMEGRDVYKVAKDPKATGIDVATQAAEGVSKLAGATAGGLAGAAAGGPLAPLTGLAGGVAGYYAPEMATKALRWATGQDTTSPVDRTNDRAQALRAQVKPASTAQRQGPFTDSFEKKMAALPSAQPVQAAAPEAAAPPIPQSTAPSADYLRRQYAPPVYDDTNASWKHSPTEINKPQGNTWIDQLIGLRQAKAERLRATTERGQDIIARGQDMGHQATLRGQDLGENQSVRSNDTTRWTGERSLAQNLRQMNWDRQKFDIETNQKERDFGLRADEYGHKQNVDARTARESATTAAFNTFKNSLPTVQDPKSGEMVPDVQGANRYMAGLQAHIANRVNALRAQGTKASMEQAASLEAQGPAGLPQSTIQDIIDGMDMKQRVDTRLGQLVLNGGAEGRTSNDPTEYLIDQDGTAKLGDPKRVVTRGGHKVSMADVARERIANRGWFDFDYSNPPTSRHLRNQ